MFYDLSPQAWFSTVSTSRLVLPPLTEYSVNQTDASIDSASDSECKEPSEEQLTIRAMHSLSRHCYPTSRLPVCSKTYFSKEPCEEQL